MQGVLSNGKAHVDLACAEFTADWNVALWERFFLAPSSDFLSVRDFSTFTKFLVRKMTEMFPKHFVRPKRNSFQDVFFVTSITFSVSFLHKTQAVLVRFSSIISSLGAIEPQSELQADGALFPFISI